ncbi:MAG: TRAP transporter large permease [Burkholderiales bacterium]
MEPLTIGYVGCAAFVALICLRAPVAYAMAIVGTLGLFSVYDATAVFKFVPTEMFTHTSSFTLAALPLFLLMGYLAFYADLARDSYEAAKAWFGKVPGGLAVGTVYGCAIFGACSGSSLATCAVFSKISVPEMIRAGYNRKLSLGVVAAGGGLDVLIPPSIIMVIYGVMTETSIGKLLIAGILPGILYACVFAVAIATACWLKPELAPRIADVDTSWPAKWRSVKNLWAVTVLFVLVLGAIYAGWATPDEAAAVGVVGSIVLLIQRRRFSWAVVRGATIDSAKASAMIFLLLGTATIFAKFLSVTGVISTMTKAIMDLGLPFWALILALTLLYLILGCFLDAISMMILTLPLVAPLITAHGQSLIWFGVFITMMAAIGAVTPPLGLNCFVMKGALGDEVELNEIFLGAAPFVVLMIAIALIIAAFPELSLWLPNYMAGR